MERKLTQAGFGFTIGVGVASFVFAPDLAFIWKLVGGGMVLLGIAGLAGYHPGRGKKKNPKRLKGPLY